MVFRFILRYFANNEQLVNKLADSYPVRRLARWVVYFANKLKTQSPSFQIKNTEDALKKIKENLEKKLKEK